MLSSLRKHNPEIPAILLLLDFSEEEFTKMKELVKPFAPISLERGFSKDYPQVTDTFQFYRNCRVDFFIEALDRYPADDLVTIAANGFIRRDISFISDLLETNEFIFRERRNRKIRECKSLRDFPNWVTEEQSKDVEALARNVLLGTHAMQNTERVRIVLRRWQELIHSGENINLMWSDMGNFVRALLDIEKEQGQYQIKTYHNQLPDLCDCSHRPSSAIWFAKNHFKRRRNQNYKAESRLFLEEFHKKWK